MMSSPSDLKERANSYIDIRTRSSGVPFPLVGQHRDLVIVLMAAFACDVLADELRELMSDTAV